MDSIYKSSDFSIKSYDFLQDQLSLIQFGEEFNAQENVMIE